MWGMGDVNQRIEGIVQCTKRYCTILRKLKKCGGGGGGAIFVTQNTLYVFKKEKRKKIKKIKKN